MNEKKLTLLRLEAAFERLSGKHVPGKRISIRAIETEAGLGNGSAYYYPEFIRKVYTFHHRMQTISGDQKATSYRVRGSAGDNSELIRLKKKFHNEVLELRKFNAQIAADQYRQMSELNEARIRIRELEDIIADLQKQLTEAKRKLITPLPKKPRG